MYAMASRAVAAATSAPDPFSAVTPATRQLYQHLLKRIKTIGPFRIETKKTSVHLTRKSAFAGVHPRKAFLMLTIKSGRSGTTQDIDGTLLGWLKQAHELCD
jgi:hypothetical protein